MNTKKNKHKGRPAKPQNPVPPQTADTNVAVSETTENLPSSPVAEKPEAVLESEERVPEIVSQVKNVIEGKDETESPKKPKRNRGKKKKSEKDEVDEIETEAAQNIEDDEKTEIKKEFSSDAQDLTVAPTSRKKKGKNKSTEQVETENLNVVHKPVETKSEPKKLEQENILDSPRETMDQQIIPTKKKNKKNKKNRTDSEKSEKAEELSCTAAFQKILVPKDETDIKIKDTIKKGETKDSAVTDISVTESTNKEVAKTSEDTMTTEESTIKEVTKTCEEIIPTEKSDDKCENNFQKDNQKSKKKNKRDKKDNQKEDYLHNIKIVNLEVLTVQDDKPMESTFIVKDDLKDNKQTIEMTKDITEKEDITLSSTCDQTPEKMDVFVKEASPKPKAKIAKPVEKRGKDKHAEIKVQEECTKADTERPTQKESHQEKDKSFDISMPIENECPVKLLSKENLLKHNVLEMEIKSPTMDIPLDTLEEAEELKLPKIEEKEHLITDDKKIPFEKAKPHQKKGKERPHTSKQQLKTSERDTVFDTKTTDIPIVAENIMKEGSSHELKPSSEIQEDKSDPLLIDKVMDTKRMKSPKPTKNSVKLPSLDDSTKSDEDIMICPITENITPEAEITTSQDAKQTTETDSELTPDLIEHPRSTSAQLPDGNNNTVIQEVNTPSNLFAPIFIPETPFIQGSGETPTPDVISPVEKTTSPRDSIEKSDLKSKVLEVNKDMEELRLSLERSLAEFTQLEKDNKELDNKLDTPKGSIEKLTELKESTHETKNEPLIDTQLLVKKDGEKHLDDKVVKKTDEPEKQESSNKTTEPPVCPARKDNKGKGKSKKKCKQEQQSLSPALGVSSDSKQESKDTSKETKKEEKIEQQHKSGNEQENTKKQSDSKEDSLKTEHSTDFDPIENFEDAMTSSADDVNKTFEVIVDEVMHDNTEKQTKTFSDNPQINITEPDDSEKSKEEKQIKQNPLVSQPKNLLGRPEIPARSNKTDYKKEKNKTPNTKLAKVKIKDSVELDKEAKSVKHSKESQTENKPKFLRNKNVHESVTCVTSENDEYVYKYSFRKVFLSSNCHVCKKDLKSFRVPCNFCNLLFYCGQRHKDEDYTNHQAFCFAVSTVVHLKGQKHIYADAKGVTGHNYRLLRMQMIVSCERILKRKLSAWEQEALLYPRMCADAACREWRQGKLMDCDPCGQISYCKDHPEHLPNSHGRWCKSYSLYQKLVLYQLTQGRLDPKLPGRLLTCDRITDNINRLLADMYDEKIDINDMQYAALTQLATAPLTAAYSYQMYHDKMKSFASNGVQKSPTFTVHVVGAELQFEADSLHKWETFFLHLKPDINDLRVVLIGPELNPSNLPLDLLGKIKLCPTCRVDKRRLTFSFQDKQLYHEYVVDDDFFKPDIVCAFNPSISRCSSYNDIWSSTITSIFKLKVPLIITSYSMNELLRDLSAIKTSTKLEFNIVSEAKYNPFASVRPDRNFITDDEIPLLFKNYCYMVLIGAF